MQGQGAVSSAVLLRGLTPRVEKVGGAGGGRVSSASADKDTRTEMACRYRILLYCTVLYCTAQGGRGLQQGPHCRRWLEGGGEEEEEID